MMPADPRDRAFDPRYRDHDLTPLQRLEKRVAGLEAALAKLEKTVSASNYVHLEDCHVKRLTDAAALVQFADADGEVQELWFPKSQIADADDLSMGGPQTVSITKWIAEQKEIGT